MDIVIKTTLLVLTLVIIHESHHVYAESEGDLRLVDGRTNTSGRVEIYHMGQWGTVCDDNFGTRDASVVCNQIGHGDDMRPLVWRGVPRGSGQVWLDEVACDGDEWSLSECRNAGWAEHDCTHSEDAGVECDGRSFVGDLRLVGPTKKSGRLEVRWGGQWGPVCASGFGDRDALVACRTLGFDVKVVATSSEFGRSSDDIQLSRVDCTGSESSLTECSFRGPFRVHEACEGDRQIGITCVDQSNLQSRLTGGSATSGRLELAINHEWKTVCSATFNDNAAKVACRMLGLPSGYAVTYKFQITRPEATNAYIWGIDVRCDGSEANILDCEHGDRAIYDCEHSEDIGVFCTDDDHEVHHHKIRLAGSESNTTGRIEVEYFGIWGTVCDDGWSLNNTKVVCRSLHLPYDNARVVRAAQYGEGSGPSWLDNVGCSGEEHSLFDCPHLAFGQENCEHSEDVAVSCE